ncbi:DUF4811 domain-containing protein [Streptococcus didelphis]|uniref:DUF4811 domain-containing protein n=1 Tax=Streptococcus didelphis TaxID=102886 RepID=UPI00035E8415|nr:DUF4811 domain-containing protein [Streptococcus didelphis]WMB29775.1 DUF4811 domain-containing protein [Streptococcus didelphis]
MIILLIALATILTFVTWMLIKPAVLRLTLGILSLVFLVASVAFLTDHFVNHTGMGEKTLTQTKQIYSAGDLKAPFGLVIYQKAGTKSDHHILVFRDKPSQKEAQPHFIPDKKNINQAIKKTARYQLTDSDTASLTTKTNRYVWKSNFYKLMFGFGDEEGELISQEAILNVPKDTWLVLDKKEASQLKNLAKQLQEKQATQAQANPEKALELKTLAQKNPKAFAKMQVEALKQALAKKN